MKHRTLITILQRIRWFIGVRRLLCQLSLPAAPPAHQGALVVAQFDTGAALCCASSHKPVMHGCCMRLVLEAPMGEIEQSRLPESYGYSIRYCDTGW